MSRNESDTLAKPNPTPRPVAIDTAQLAAEAAEQIVRPLLANGNGPIDVRLGDGEEVSGEYVQALFGGLMRSAMAAGGRRLALEWMERLQVNDSAAERAHRAMAGTVNLDLRFGMLAPPLAVQAGCRPELLEHEQQDADCIARLAVRGIATDSMVHRMRQRLVKRIVKTVSEDTQPQTMGSTANTPRENR